MKHYFKLFLDKLLCKHKWEKLHAMKEFNYEHMELPQEVRYTYVCKECGKFKKIII